LLLRDLRLPWVSHPADEFVYTKEQYTPLHEIRFAAAAIRMEVVPWVKADALGFVTMSPKKTQLQVVPRKPQAGGERGSGAHHSKPPLVSGRWLLAAVCMVVAAAAACGWLALCLLFWQGSWQLLYHPSANVQKTPANAGLAFDPVAFAVTDAGVPQLRGWWIPAAQGPEQRRLTVVYLHGQDGNIEDAVDALARLHGAGVNALAFDYRAFGESKFAKPSERNWRQDAEWALDYLNATRHIDARTIVLDGTNLGANLAFEIAAKHPELAGVIVDSPMADPMAAIFKDARARMVPAHLLVRDRYDLDAAAGAVRIPVLWFERADAASATNEPAAYKKVAAHKMLVWVNPQGDVYAQTENALSRWLDELPGR
jgi:pimeloyl-ACP methyl ester carboxylesterase